VMENVKDTMDGLKQYLFVASAIVEMRLGI
jgi:hypothetical protein